MFPKRQLTLNHASSFHCYFLFFTTTKLIRCNATWSSTWSSNVIGFSKVWKFLLCHTFTFIAFLQFLFVAFIFLLLFNSTRWRLKVMQVDLIIFIFTHSRTCIVTLNIMLLWCLVSTFMVADNKRIYYHSHHLSQDKEETYCWARINKKK